MLKCDLAAMIGAEISLPVFLLECLVTHVMPSPSGFDNNCIAFPVWWH